MIATQHSNGRDPYTTLGVPRTAKPDDIRRAYRRKAKEAHPDAGGSADKFAEVARAHSILSDPGRRLTYDTTGHAEEAAPDNKHASAVGIIHSILDQVIEQIPEPTTVNLIAVIGDQLDNGRKQLLDQIAKQKQAIAKTEAITKRFHCGKQGENLIKSMMDQRAAGIRKIIANAETQLSHVEYAQKILKDYRFDFDAPMQTFTFTNAGTSSSW